MKCCKWSNRVQASGSVKQRLCHDVEEMTSPVDETNNDWKNNTTTEREHDFGKSKRRILIHSQLVTQC